MNWSVLLSTRAPLALLYALQIVHGLLDADVNLRPELTTKGFESSPRRRSIEFVFSHSISVNDRFVRAEAHEQATARWRARFVASGGVAYLISILLATDSSSTGALRFVSI